MWGRIRRRVLERDSYRCRECGGGGGQLEVHHVDGDRSNDALSNLRTLCVSDHIAALRSLARASRCKPAGVAVALPVEVHHVNGDRTDNRIENLYGCNDRLPPRVIHDRLRGQPKAQRWRNLVRELRR